MKETKPTHTLGPWTVGPLRAILGRAFTLAPTQIVDKVRGGSMEAADANAHLIAAAPDLFVALRDVLNVIAADDLIPETVSYMRQARAAIAKAENR